MPPPNSPQYLEQLKILPLVHASAFCQIATRIQDRLVECPNLPPAETASYDAHLVKWHDELPLILSNPNEPCPEFLRRTRLVMKWRFQNIRIILHRPFLLTAALRRAPWAALSTEEKVAIRKCRHIALKTIEDISQECMPDLICCWNAVWFCFQACMVPLVSLFSDASMPEETEKWKSSIETALAFFEQVKDWSIAAKRSGDVVTRLYAAYKTHASTASHQAQAQPQPQAQVPQMAYPQQQGHTQMHAHFGVAGTQAPSMLNTDAAAAYTQQHAAAFSHFNPATPTWSNMRNDPAILNNFWDDMMWDTNIPDMLETPFGLGNEYDYASAVQEPGSGGPCWMNGS